MKDWIKELETIDFSSGVYSQSYQDELLSIIFDNIGTTNPTPFCVEFGFDSNSLEAGKGANVARLVIENNWDALLLDGDHENLEINLHRHFVSSSNIVEIFRRYNVPEEPEYISIDVDSTDLWIFDSLLGEYKAMVYSVEYNSHFPLDAAITFPNDANERWEGDRGYGASLKALNMVAEKHGYSLLWVIPALDAIFVRNDLIEDGSDQLCFPFKRWKDCTKLVRHLPLKNKERAKIFIDYEFYSNNGQDSELSKLSAYPVCKNYLVRKRVFQRIISKIKRLFWRRAY